MVSEKPRKVFPLRWEVLANPSFSERRAVTPAWRRDMWTPVSSFTALQGQGTVLEATLADSEGQHWLVFVVHIPNEPCKQQKLWTCLRQERHQISNLPLMI